MKFGKNSFFAEFIADEASFCVFVNRGPRRKAEPDGAKQRTVLAGQNGAKKRSEADFFCLGAGNG
jgi:hypothetical protein